MTRTSRRGSGDRSNGTVLLDALVAIVLLASAVPASVAGITAVVRSSARLHAAAVEAVQASAQAEVRVIHGESERRSR